MLLSNDVAVSWNSLYRIIHTHTHMYMATPGTLGLTVQSHFKSLLPHSCMVLLVHRSHGLKWVQVWLNYPLQKVQVVILGSGYMVLILQAYRMQEL